MNSEGISATGGLLDVALELGIITKSGSFYSYEGKVLAQGREGSKVALTEDKKLKDEIEKQVRASLTSGKALPKELGEPPADTDDTDTEE
jgi:recombination protein RecA